ncbi:MAG: sensor domain-containing protein [Acidimicrobiales bacterium]
MKGVYRVADLARQAPGGSGSRDGGSPEARLASVLDLISQSLAEATASFESTLEMVARTTVSVMGGSCVLWITDEALAVTSVGAAFDGDPARSALLGRAFKDWHHPLSEGLFATLMEGPSPITLNPIQWAELAGWADPGAPDLLAGLGPAALTLVPLQARGTVPGILGLLRESTAMTAKSPQGSLEEEEAHFLRRLGGTVALAIDNARLLRSAEREIAERRLAEEARKLGEATIGVVARSGPILLFACDKDANILLMDGGLLTQFQRRPESFVNKNFMTVFRDFPLATDFAHRVLGGEHIRRAPFPLGAYSLEIWATPLRASDGTVSGFAGIVVDASARVAAEAAVLEAARRQSALVEHASDMIMVMSPDATVRYVNPAVQRILGYAWQAGDVIDIFSLIHPDDRERCRQAVRTALRTPGPQEPVDWRVMNADGSVRHVQSIGNNLMDDPAVAGFVITLRDMTEEHRAGERYRAHAERQAALADLGRWALVGLEYGDLVADAVKVLTEQVSADIVHVFDALPDADFITLAASRGQVVTDNELFSAEPTSSPASFALMTQQTVTCDDLAEEQRFDVPDLWTRAGCVTLVEEPIPGQDQPVGVLGVGRREASPFTAEDVSFVTGVANVLAAASARNRAEQLIREQALQDPLTGLPNRIMLTDQGSGWRSPDGRDVQRASSERTVFVLDIDRFKEINDTLGHQTGDVVLVEAARRLLRVGEPIELVARLGGDEFALVARAGRNDDDRLTARVEEDKLAARILASLGEALDVGGVNLRLRASIGIASADVDRDGLPLQVPALLRRAEAAMYQAKAEHQGVRRYSDDLERSSLSRLALASELAEAIDSDQLELDYQPQVSCPGGVITGVEALVRWQHPTRGLLLPDVFVPLAEQTGIIRELTEWVLLRGLAECASWHRAGHAIPVAVNLSAGTVHDPGLLDLVLAALARNGLPPSAIELEITESAVMRDPKGALRSLEALTSRGVRFSLDDFGTGYSSLGYLQRLPVASVKIDKSFVMPLANAEDLVASAIVRAVVELGHSLTLDVIAEGVESTSVLAAVVGLGCDAVQGFHVAMPMEAQRLQRWMAEHDPAAFARQAGPPRHPGERRGTEEAPSLPG